MIGMADRAELLKTTVSTTVKVFLDLIQILYMNMMIMMIRFGVAPSIRHGQRGFTFPPPQIQ